MRASDGRASSRRRTPREWALRLALATGIAVGGYQAVTLALAQVVVKSDPALAYQLAPRDGRVAAIYAASLTTPEATAAQRDRGDAIARSALRRDPTAVAAVSALGINADIGGDTASARRLFGYARKLSRRDLTSQLWSIEDAVGRNQIAEALYWYDVALRTNPPMATMLFPTLSAASSDPAIRGPLIRLLTREPAWGGDFLNHAAANSGDPAGGAALLSGARRARIEVPASADAALIAALLNAGETERAWTYYASIRPGADRRMSRDARFTGGVDAPTAFDWQPVNDGGLTTSIEGNLFDFMVPVTVGGRLLTQGQALPPGRYRLSGRSQGIEQQQSALPYWMLACADGRELGRVTVGDSGQDRGTFTGAMSVPDGCPIQTLSLVARPSDAIGGLSGQILQVELRPMPEGQ